jgi:nicotinamidase-related amidase
MANRTLSRASVEHATLVVVDVQGKLARLMHESEAMIEAQAVLIRGCRLLGIPVVWAEQLPEKLGPTVEELQEPLRGLEPIAKSSFGCLGDAELRCCIESGGRGQVLLCGIETHVCVWQTAAGLLERDLEVHLIADATSSRSAFNREIGLRRMQGAGVYLSTVEMALFELIGDAVHPEFRELARLLK